MMALAKWSVREGLEIRIDAEGEDAQMEEGEVKRESNSERRIAAGQVRRNRGRRALSLEVCANPKGGRCTEDWRLGK